MSADQYNSERALEKKVQWGALIVHRHQHAGGRLDGSTFQVEAGASLLATGSGDADGIPDYKAAGDGAAGEQTSPHFAAIIPASAPHAAVGSSYIQRSRQRQLSLAAVAPAPNNRKSIAQRQTRAAVGTLIEKGVVESTAVSSGRGRRAGFPLTVRSTGTKDRHSKVRTAKGLRDRRVRLSAATAIQFFDVQDRLGYDQPSKAVDWLINNARDAIDELGPVQGVILGDGEVAAAGRAVGKETEEGRYRDRDNPSIKVKEEEQRSSGGGVIAPVGSSGRAESRVKARERARERAKEKSAPAGTEPTASVTTVAQAPPLQPSRPSSPNLEEILLLTQLRQQNSQPPPTFDQRHQHPQPRHHHLSRPLQPSDFSPFTIYPQTTSIATAASNSATQMLPLPSHFYHMAAAPPPPTSRVPFVYNDVPPLHSFSFISAPQIYNTPISPRGTLQSIFSNSVSSVPQVPMPLHVMGQQGYRAAPGPEGGNGGGYHGAADVVSPDLRQNSRIPLRFHDMELDPQEETRMPSSSMADFQ